MKNTGFIDSGMFLLEADFNCGCGFDTMEEAIRQVENRGDDYVNYTILPYIYMTN